VHPGCDLLGALHVEIAKPEPVVVVEVELGTLGTR